MGVKIPMKLSRAKGSCAMTTECGEKVTERRMGLSVYSVTLKSAFFFFFFLCKTYIVCILFTYGFSFLY